MTETARTIIRPGRRDENATQAGQAGLEALAFYHERKDEARNIGLEPEHDWSSHAADAFGLMAVVYEEPPARGYRSNRTNNRPSTGTTGAPEISSSRMLHQVLTPWRLDASTR
jgi:hypothetical protein